MSGMTVLTITIGEDGSDSRRIDWLTAEMRDLLGSEPGCTARLAERPSDRTSSKGALEIMPGAIAVALTATANLRVVATLLAQWVHRDDQKHVRISPAEHGVDLILDGMGAAEVEAVLAALRNAGAHGDDGV